MQIIDIDTLDLPDLEPYRTLRGQTQHWRDGHLVAEGEKAVRALLESTIVVSSMLLSRDWLPLVQETRHASRLDHATVYVAPDALLEGIVGFPLHKSLMAIGRLPENPSLDALRAAAPASAVYVALEGIADAETMGMILRNCAAFGVAGLIVGPDSTSPYLRRSVRVSLGNVFSLRIHRSEDVLATVRQCREEFDWHVMGTTPRGGSAVIDVAASRAPLCLLFGSEATGLTDAALSICDDVFTIPMRNDVDSINVANAVAVTLYAAMRE